MKRLPAAGVRRVDLLLLCPAFQLLIAVLLGLQSTSHLLPSCPAFRPEFRQLDEQLVAMAAAVDSNDALFIDDAELAKVRRMWCGSCGACPHVTGQLHD